MPAARAASAREAPSSTRARASIRREAAVSRHRLASRRSSTAPGSFRVIATVTAPPPIGHTADQPRRAPRGSERDDASAIRAVGITLAELAVGGPQLGQVLHVQVDEADLVLLELARRLLGGGPDRPAVEALRPEDAVDVVAAEGRQEGGGPRRGGGGGGAGRPAPGAHRPPPPPPPP